MKEGVSIYGGYNNNNWNDRDNIDRENPTYQTVINDIRDSNNIQAISCGSGLGITTATVIDGFTINAATTSGIFSSGITNLQNSSPTISNNTINGGSGTNSYGISSAGNGSSTISNNTINGGNGSTNSYGISIDSCVPTIKNNIIFTSGSG